MPTTTKTQSLDELRAEVAKAEADLAQRTARMEAEAALADQRRIAALRDYDRGVVEQFDSNVLDQAVNDAERVLTEAIVVGPWPEIRDAYVAVNRSREIRRATIDRTKAALTALGIEHHTRGLNGPTPVGTIDLFARVEETLKRHAVGQAQDAEDQVAQARVAAGEQAARGK